MKKRTIFLSIKDSANYNLIADLLQKEGHRVEKLSGADRTELVKDADAVLVDHVTGLKLCSILKVIKESTGPFLPVLALLPLTTPAEPWLNKGFDDIIRMPVDKAEFRSRIKIFFKLRAQSEQIIKKAEQKYKAIFDATGTATIIVGEDTTIILANNECEEVTGYTSGQLIGKRWTEFVYKEDLALMLSRHRERRKNPSSVKRKYEVRLINAKGEIRNVILFITMIPGTKQSVVSMLDITERKRAEEELKNSEERLKILFEYAPDAYYLNDSKGRFIDGNKAAENLIGYKKEELIGKNILNLGLLSPKELLKALNVLQKNIQGQSTGPDEFTLNRKDGSQVSVEIQTYPVKIKGKTVILGIARDITERKQAEMALKESEEKFRLAFQNSPDAIAICRWDDDTCLEVNKGFTDILGYLPREIVGKTSLGLNIWVNPEDRDKARKILEEKGAVYNLETELRAKNGDIKTGMISAVMMTINNEPCLLVIARNITEFKKAQEKLRESEERYRSIFHGNASIMLLIKPETEKIIDANKAACQYYGYSYEKLTSMKISDINIMPETKVKAEMARAVNGERDYFQFQHRLSDGSVRDVEVFTSKVLIDNKPYLFSIMHDITERKQAEKALQERERTYGTLINNLPGFAYRCLNDKNWTMLYISKGCEDVTGYSSDDLINNNNIAYSDIIDPDYREEIWNLWQTVLKNRSVFEYEYPVITKNKEIKWVWERGCGIYSDKGELLFLEGFITDVTERKKAEEKIKHLNLVLRAIRNVNQLITKEKDRNKVINGVCKNLIINRGYTNAWIVLFDESGKFASSAEAGIGKDFLLISELFVSGRNTVCGEKALKQSDPVITEFPKAECKDCPISGMYADRGAMTIRLEHAGKIYGLMTVSISRELAQNYEEIELFKEMGGDIAFALHSIEVGEKRKQAEKALKESEAKFRSLFSEMTEGVYLHEIVYNERGEAVNYRIIEANPASEKHLNIKPGYAIGKLATELYGTKDAPFLDIYSSVAETGKSVIFEEYFPPMKKHFRISAYSPEKGKFATVFINITERKKAEEALKESHDKYRTFINTASDFMCITDEEGRFTEVNESMINKLGYSRDELIGNHFSCILPKEFSDKRLFPNLKSIIKNGKITIDTTLQTKKGNKLYCELKAIGIYDENNKFIGSRAVIYDLTHRKRAEEKIKKLNEELEMRVVERTRKLEASNRMLEDFVYSVSHDLKAPLRAIRGFAEIISRRYAKSLNGEALHYFDNIVDASDEMETLIADLLKYARLSRNTMSLCAVSLSDVIGKILYELESSGATKDAQIIVDSDLPVVKGIPTLVRQVFSNLIENALKFRRTGVAHCVQIRGRVEETWAIVEVKDNGIGIGSEYHEKIFNIFQRLHRQDVYPGTGVGLAIVKKAVELMNGTVEVESEKGEGSKFRVKLEVARGK